jgi:putative colanic acid biosynthesis acetyltransferase WcaF
MRLDHYTTYPATAPLWQQLLWYFFGDPLFRSRVLFFSGLKVWLLRRFGAEVGQGVRIKPCVRVKFPWRLTIGDHVWIGENAWIDNISQITIGDHVCISQEVYLCTGNHDWSDANFRLLTQPIVIHHQSWIAARAIVGAGVTVGQGAVLTMGSVTGRSLDPMTVYSGNPAQPVRVRKLADDRSDHRSNPKLAASDA